MNDPAREEESLDLLAAFFRIDDPAIRKTIIELAKAAASGASFKVTRYQEATPSTKDLN